jgi:DNA-3-methyladenine glycosylase II
VTPAEVARAEAAIERVDPAMRVVIRSAGPCTLTTSGGTRRSHFESLARSIAHQQLAGRAAAAIWARVRALVPGPFTAEAVLLLAEEELRGAGLSRAKARSVHDLAAKVQAGEVRLGRIGTRADDAIVAELSQVRGVGRWTAEMFLMFQLGRPDVWPTGDLGVRSGYARLHGLDGAPPPIVLEELGERYRPWRSVAAWYCWRVLDVTSPGA